MSRPLNESILKSALMRELKERCPELVALRHEDVRTAGIPDLSLTGNGLTSWWEFKFDDADGFESPGIQELTMLRLARGGFARYVVWQVYNDKRLTMVVHPSQLKQLHTDQWCNGLNMKWLAEQMRLAHYPNP